MSSYTEASDLATIISAAGSVVIIQADNPDADSLGSALALEQILSDAGKETSLYCGVDIPQYLHYLSGWSRVQKELPNQFDSSIIVDASTLTLLEKMISSGHQGWLAAKPCIVLDHHSSVDNVIPFAKVMINDPSCSSTGELIYGLAKQLVWPLAPLAQEMLMTAILGDTQGLSNQLTNARTYRIMAEMTEAGIDRQKLEELRREYSKMPVEIYTYKATLINRTEFVADNRVAMVAIPQAEISHYSPLYNPAPLIQNDMLQTEGVLVSIVFKHYADGKITAAIRCNSSAPIGSKLAEHFGGGGHPYASGFKINGGRSFAAVKSECAAFATELLDNQPIEN